MVNLQTPGKIIFTSAGKKTVSLTYDPQLWTVTKEFPSTDGMEYKSFKTKWDNHPVQRIVLISKTFKQKGKHVFVISKST